MTNKKVLNFIQNNKIANAVYAQTTKMKDVIVKNSPEILMVTGIVGVISGTILACKATTKLDSIMKQSNDRMDKLNKISEEFNSSDDKKEIRDSKNGKLIPYTTINGEIYTLKDYQKDKFVITMRTCLDVAKEYAPASIVLSLGIASLLGSNRILKERNTALIGYAAALNAGWKKYRGNVIEKYGDQVDYELLNNIHEKEIEKSIIDEKGNEKTVKETVKVKEADADLDKYTFLFDEMNPDWTNDAYMNRNILEGRCNFCNSLLQARGYVFLNEVLDALSIKQIPEGQYIGWVYDKTRQGKCHNYIDFGLNRPGGFDVDSDDYMYDTERSIKLHFNVDGYILDKVRF